LRGIPTSTSGDSALAVARAAAQHGGRLLMEHIDRVKSVSFKGRGNIVTDVDVLVEGEILAILRREFPDMGILAEESLGVKADAGYVWIVDPLDGTRNYASGIPYFSVVVGLALNGEVLVGVNYDPARDEMFDAERGVGAFLNGQPIRVSEKSAIQDSIVGMDLSYNNEGAVNGLEVITSIWPGMQTARIMGSSALGISYAAAGLTDLYFHHQLEPWDQVAGLLLVREAGGVITDRTGRPAELYSDGLLASNATLHAEFMRKTDGMAWRRPTHMLA
jgi:myo-inositol-1(or 4)-monophosphatase